MQLDIDKCIPQARTHTCMHVHTHTLFLLVVVRVYCLLIFHFHWHLGFLSCVKVMHETAFLSFLFFFLSFWTRKINFVIKLFVEWVKNKKSMLFFSFAWSFVDSFLRFKVDIRRVSDKLRFDGLAFLAVDGVHSEPSHRLCHRDESGESRKGPRKA